MATSLNLINGLTGQFSLGHAGFMAIGAYVSAVCTMFFHMPFIVSIIIGAICAGALGLLIGIPTLRLSGDYLAIATLGLGEIIRVCILNIPAIGGASGLTGIPRETTFAWAFFVMLFTLMFIKNFTNSSYGRACIAIRENEIAATSMGVNPTKFKVLAFTLGAMFAGVGGALFSHYFNVAHPSSFTFLKSFDFLTMVVLGGLGSISGSVIGAIFLTLISAVLQDFPEIRMIIYALVMIFLMIFRPSGLLGSKELTSYMMSFRRGGTVDADADNN